MGVALAEEVGTSRYREINITRETKPKRQQIEMPMRVISQTKF